MGFYPHGQPDWYSYTKHFETVGHDTIYHFAFNNTKYPGMGVEGSRDVVYAHAIANLESLIAGARAAEMAFLADTGIDVTNMNGRDLFYSINEIFNSRQTFERGLKYMKQLSTIGKKDDPEKEQMYRDVSRYFAFYLNEAIAKELKGKRHAQLLRMTPQEVEALINQIISKALILSYKRVKDFIGKDGNIRGKFGDKSKERDNEQAKRAVTDMIHVINKLKKQNAFGKMGYLFNLDVNDVDTLWNRRKNSQVVLKNTQYDRAKVDSKYAGNALELITSMVATEIGKINVQNSSGDLTLNIIGKHTGQDNEMKADTLLFVGHGTINPSDYLQFVDKDSYDSVRMQNIDAMEQYLNSLNKNIDHVIAISDKNYSITAGFDGIDAQSRMNLQNVGEMLTRFGVGQVRELINYLANCGTSMIQGEVNSDVRTVLQTQIAYYLFDNLHFEIKGSAPSVNVVNLLNVSGIYIPLSVYLEGVCNSIKDALSMSPSSLVSVSVSLGGPTEQNVWTAATWDSFREEHETQSFIEYTILKNMANFISELTN